MDEQHGGAISYLFRCSCGLHPTSWSRAVLYRGTTHRRVSCLVGSCSCGHVIERKSSSVGSNFTEVRKYAACVEREMLVLIHSAMNESVPNILHRSHQSWQNHGRRLDIFPVPLMAAAHDAEGAHHDKLICRPTPSCLILDLFFFPVSRHCPTCARSWRRIDSFLSSSLSMNAAIDDPAANLVIISFRMSFVVDDSSRWMFSSSLGLAGT